MDRRDNFKKGSIEMLALKLLSEKDCYGYELCQLMQERSDNIINVPKVLCIQLYISLQTKTIFLPMR